MRGAVVEHLEGTAFQTSLHIAGRPECAVRFASYWGATNAQRAFLRGASMNEAFNAGREADRLLAAENDINRIKTAFSESLGEVPRNKSAELVEQWP